MVHLILDILFYNQILLQLQQQKMDDQCQNYIVLWDDDNEIGKFIHKKLNICDVRLDEGQWYRYGMSDNCKLMKQWRVWKLWIGSNKRKQILKELGTIDLNCLKYLYLEDNRIQSVEGIHRFTFTNIRFICLSENRINKIGPITKTKWDYLQYLLIDQNMIRDGQKLTNLHLIIIECLAIDSFDDNYQFDNFSWILKMQAREFEGLAKNYGGILSDKLEKVFNQKHKYKRRSLWD